MHSHVCACVCVCAPADFGSPYGVMLGLVEQRLRAEVLDILIDEEDSPRGPVRACGWMDRSIDGWIDGWMDNVCNVGMHAWLHVCRYQCIHARLAICALDPPPPVAITPVDSPTTNLCLPCGRRVALTPDASPTNPSAHAPTHPPTPVSSFVCVVASMHTGHHLRPRGAGAGGAAGLHRRRPAHVRVYVRCVGGVCLYVRMRPAFAVGVDG
jgi:hypothetical protein